MAADTSIKNNNQNQNAANAPQSNSLQTRENKLNNTLNPEKEANQIIKSQRQTNEVQNSQRQLAFNALFNAGPGQQNTQTKVSISRGPTSLRSRSNRTEKTKSPVKSHSQTTDSSAELREQMAIRSASNQRATAAAASNRVGQVNRAGVNNPNLTGTDQDEHTELSAQHHLVGTDTKDAYNSISQDPTQTQVTPQDALNKIELNTSTETLKLLDIVGPEAILTFREKLQQVWVNLDENAARQLDVLARMPASLTCSSAMELLAIESPQGIHFVAFLKNKNDFEVLATFDRRALLPDHSSRQLIEAGLMSYEQLDAVFKEGSQKIEEKAKDLASSKGTHDQVFLQIQQLMVQEKRRRRKFRQMIDYLVDKLDELDLEESMEEAPFVPKNLSKNNETSSETEENYEDSGTTNLDQDKDFGVQFDDSDYH